MNVVIVLDEIIWRFDVVNNRLTTTKSQFNAFFFYSFDQYYVILKTLFWLILYLSTFQNYNLIIETFWNFNENKLTFSLNITFNIAIVTFWLHDFIQIFKTFYFTKLSNSKLIIFNIIINFSRLIQYRFIKFIVKYRFIKFIVKFHLQKSINWFVEWVTHQLTFVKIVRNFYNVIKFYRKIDYYCSFQKSQNQTWQSFNNSIVNDVSIKFDSNDLSLLFDIEFDNSLSLFDKQISSQVSSYSFIFDLSIIEQLSQQVIFDTFVEKIIYNKFLSFSSNEYFEKIDVMTNFISKQQRTITIII